MLPQIKKKIPKLNQLEAFLLSPSGCGCDDDDGDFASSWDCLMQTSHCRGRLLSDGSARVIRIFLRNKASFSFSYRLEEYRL